MRWAERCCAVVTLCIAATASAAAADQSKYGKVDTFEPGKKYNCVPSADHKSWDCSQTGKVSERDAPQPSHDEPVPATPAKPRPAATASPPPPTAAPRASALPSYLLAPGASDHAASSAPASVAAPAPAAAAKTAAPPAATETSKPTAAPVETPKPAVAPIVHSSTNTQAASAVAAPPPEPAAAPVAKPAAPVVAAAPPEPKTAPPPPAPKPAEPAAEKPAAPMPAVPTPAPVATSAPTPPRAATASGSGAFLNVPGEQYVIELAHAEHEADIATARAAVHVPRGEVYELHLRQNGGDVWLLVWGSFADVGAARAARGELPADVHAGWPRRVAPLQAEIRRAQE